ncbi:hsp20/alpha crystallin family protein [Anoxybacillus sp. B7M1]|jgi:HSP20 family protein|uniref:Hsp20/alpha crystallin family protein n=1 Tax=unclassified Anoxybacillus TaxID=2639704 RepID=UPI0005CD45F7|nr:MULTISPECIES: Hsp20 family protein [unclassified Anoxybacillus]ANB57536.1 hsp20/alpha crystallin family protein [Anoxybacillus sp. B2M1]ANB65465.1 hsp20/alpha crystallin family protein [Anoxybacillus sp. B7M1]
MKTSPFGSFPPDWTKHWENFFNEDFWGSFQSFLPATEKSTNTTGVNIYKKMENELLIVVCLPGLEDIEHVELYTYYRALEIKATINLHFQGFELVEEGIFQGTWEKTIPLPFPIKEERIEATYHHGLLIIHLHRLIPDVRKRRIDIKKTE